MQQIFDFLRPRPSLSTVDSVHTTRREVVRGEEEEVGRRRRMPMSDGGAGVVVSVTVREGRRRRRRRRMRGCSSWLVKGGCSVIASRAVVVLSYGIVRVWGPADAWTR